MGCRISLTGELNKTPGKDNISPFIKECNVNCFKDAYKDAANLRHMQLTGEKNRLLTIV